MSAAGALHPHATIAARTAGTAGVEVVAEAHQTRSIWIRSISERAHAAPPGSEMCVYTTNSEGTGWRLAPLRGRPTYIAVWLGAM